MMLKFFHDMDKNYTQGRKTHMSLFYYFIQSIPESMGLFALSLAFARVPLRWRRIFIGGAILSIISYIIRALPVTFGFHIPIMLFLLFIFIVNLTKVKPSSTVLAVFASFFTLALLEYLVSSAFFAYTHMEPNEALANEALWAKVGVFQAAILNLLALSASRFLKPIRGAWRK
jgi:uncharacterized membrane protein YvlD (DUF360 family)